MPKYFSRILRAPSPRYLTLPLRVLNFDCTFWLTSSPLPPFGGPNSSTDQTIRTIRFQLTRSVETRLYRRARGGRYREGYFQFGVGQRKFNGKGMDQFELEACLINCCRTDNPPPLFLHPRCLYSLRPSVSISMFRFAIFHLPSSPLFSVR